MSQREPKLNISDCQQCGASLASVNVTGFDLRQVHELPSLRLQVIEHQAEVKCCSECEAIDRGAFPADVTVPVQLDKS